MKTIAIANQKGGTGKTTTTYNLGIALTQQGYRVLMVDFDPQGNLSCYCGIPPEKDLDQTITELLMKTSCEKPIGNRECVYQTGRKEAAARVDFIPSNLRLAGFELAMGTMMCREVLLKACLEQYNNQYDYCLIDCSPSVGLLLTNALTAANEIIIPMQAQPFSVVGMSQLTSSIANVQRMRDLLTAVKNERLYPIIYVTALYGLRRSEVLGLKWDSINFAMQTLTIRHTVARVTKVVEKNKTKNASSFRSFPLTDDAVRLFKILLQQEQYYRNHFGKDYIIMEVSILLMQQIAQLFIVLLMGYVVVKAGLLKASDSKILSVVFVYLVMPCVVLNAFQIDDTPQIRTGLLYSMGIAVGMHVVFLVLNAIFKRPLKLDVVEQVNIIYSNAAALVIPLVQALLGEEYVVYSCAFVIVQLILLWTHASACLQEGAKLEWKKILTNVNLIAIVAGALLYLLHISLPTPIVSTLSSVGAMIGPMGMLLAGMAIAEVPLKKVFCTPRNYLPVALRLIVVPIIVLLLLRVFHASDWIADGKAILMTVYLSAITPSCATVTSMAQLYNRDAAHSSALYVLSTLLSIMTMPLMIGLFDMLV